MVFLSPEDRVVADRPVATRRPHVTEDTKKQNAVVLVAEDDPAILDLMERALETQPGVVIAVARDGLQAWRQVCSLHPDLVVLDKDIPGIDSAYVIRQLKMQPATSLIPVVGVTANRQAETEVMAAGCIATFAKPFDIGAFTTMVQQQLGQRPNP